MSCKYLSQAPEYFAPERDSGGMIVNKDVVKWSGKGTPPNLGMIIDVRMNNLGKGIVKGYFVEENWLGVTVKLLDPPEWWTKQNASDLDRLAHIFGVEIRE